MKKIILLLTFGLLSIFCTLVYGQENGSISGLVKDSVQKPLEGAVVSLLLVKDSSLVKSALTEANGTFLFSGLKDEVYFVLISEFEHQKYRSGEIVLDATHRALVLEEIGLLSPQSGKLDEVKITAKIPVIQHKMDRTVVNVDAMISSAGNNALELLEKSPGVIVEQNGGIMLKGKSGVMILIDDKQTYLSGQSLQDYLKTIPASAISQLEIMTNPPAKYDAAGNVGIINIVTKKSKLKGTNGNVALNYGQGIYARSFNNFSFNHRNNKFNFFANGGINANKIYSDLYINRTYRNEDQSVKSHFDQNSKFGGRQYSGNLRTGFDYYVSDKTTIGMGVSGTCVNSKSGVRNISEIRTPEETLINTVIADNTDGVIFQNGGLNFNYRKNFDSTGRSLTMDADYLRYESRGKESYLNNTYDSDGDFIATDLLTGTLPSKINIMALKLDYTHPFKDILKMETGFKSSFASTNNLVEYYNTVEQVVTMDYDKSNHFKYGEYINAAYVNLNREFKRFGFQAGLRAEHTHSEGNQLGNLMKPASTFVRDYLNLFPTVYASWKLDSAANNNLVFSYGRRLDRPFYEDLNPFVKPLDKFTFYTGNPYLRPTFSNNLSLTYSFKSLFSVMLNYNRMKNMVSETIEIDNNGIYFSRPNNLGRSEGLNLGVDASIPVGKWLVTSIYAEANHVRYKSDLYTEGLNSSGYFGYISINNSFKFGKGWSAELRGFYITDMTYAQFTFGARGNLGAGVQKKILKDKGTVKLSFNDILYTQANRGTINNLRLTDADYINYPDSRNFFLTFTYSFGKPLESTRSRTSGSSESEQQRIKQ